MGILQKQIEVKGNRYTITFPNVGQFIEIKVLEKKLSQGYSKELLMGLGEDIDAYLYVSSSAHIMVLMPDLIKDLKVNDLFELSLVDFEDLAKIYLEEIKPWLDSVKEGLRKKSE